MIKNERRITAITLGIFAFFSAACGGSDGPAAPVPLALPPGHLTVTVQTTGGDPDRRYEVLVDGTGTPRVIGLSGQTSFDIAAGARSITLADVNPNCSVVGANPVPVTITTGVTSQIVFSVACEATGIVVTVSTAGTSMPASYLLYVATPEPKSLASNSVTTVTALAPGTQSVTLGLFAENCTVVGGATVSVQVVNRALTPVRFDVQCSPITRVERIAYAVFAAGFPNSMRVVMVKPDGTASMSVAGGHSPAWSRDGNTLVISTTECSADYYYYYDYTDCTGGLVLVNPETRNLTNLNNTAGGMEPALSPSGTEVAFIRCCAPGSGGGRLYIARLDGTPAVELATKSTTISSVISVTTPAWSPDGQRLAFMCMIVPGNDDLCTMKRDGSELTRLTSTAQQHELDPSWSPDGRTIAFSLTAPSGVQVAVINAAGGTVTPLASGFNPDWSPDGTKLVFARSTGLFTMNANGSGVAQITSGGHASPTWRP